MVQIGMIGWMVGVMVWWGGAMANTEAIVFQPSEWLAKVGGSQVSGQV